MKSFDLVVSPRENLGKKDAKKLRKQEMIPCVLYGGNEIKHFYAHENALKNALYTPHVYLINLDINGEKKQAHIKEIQFHPVTDKAIHIDFQEVVPEKMSIISLPIFLTGNSAGVKAGGKLRQRKRYLKVKGLVKDMPDSLVIDITKLNIGQSILAGEIKYEGLEILDPRNSLVVGVVSSRVAAKSTDLEEEGKPSEEGGEEAGEEKA